MNDKDKAHLSGASAEKSNSWVKPGIVKMQAGSAEVGTRVVVQDGPLTEARS